MFHYVYSDSRLNQSQNKTIRDILHAGVHFNFNQPLYLMMFSAVSFKFVVKNIMIFFKWSDINSYPTVLLGSASDSLGISQIAVYF